MLFIKIVVAPVEDQALKPNLPLFAFIVIGDDNTPLLLKLLIIKLLVPIEVILAVPVEVIFPYTSMLVFFIKFYLNILFELLFLKNGQ